MRLILFKIQQKNEFIYSTKMRVKDLKKFIEFNFRFPYIQSLENQRESYNFNSYINKLTNLNLKVDYNENSIQRKPSISRLMSIVDYIDEINNFMPNSIIVSCYNNNIEYNGNNEKDQNSYEYLDYIKPFDKDNDIYFIDLDENYKMTAIDGQHRIAGFFLSKKTEVEEMELPITILFGPSLSLCSKLFVDINGNQQQVNKSLIYDLTDDLEDRFNFNKLKNKEIEDIKICHNICRVLYSDLKSPLYGQIRMLGTGYGAISQAFLVENIYHLINNGVLKKNNFQEQFDAIFCLLKALQLIFPDDWPVLNDTSDYLHNREHAEYVLNILKSQLAKTLGLGAFFIVFPIIFNRCKFDLNKYVNLLSKLKGKIVWSRKEYNELSIKYFETYRNNIMHEIGNKLNYEIENKNELPEYFEGTNKASIKKLAEKIYTIIQSD